MSRTGDEKNVPFPLGPEQPEVASLTAAEVIGARLPEFEETCRELAELYEEDLSDEIVLNELADFIADLVLSEQDVELIERCSELLEELMTLPGLDPLATVYDQVIACLPAGIRLRLRPYLGPLVDAMLARIEEEP